MVCCRWMRWLHLYHSVSFISQDYLKTRLVWPLTVIYNARMNLLARLLADSDEPLYSLADKVGFSYSTNLIRAFRRFKGVTPMEYRKAIRG
ncbi:helix-turn-helix domain-containing protein [Serratia sp. JUb9]|uniref:helix-turn-helix domain-containing protein n=1 Tax=Serratia sp. JUb9 TaxID=2724469 RepID=UPI00351C9D51